MTFRRAFPVLVSLLAAPLAAGDPPLSEMPIESLMEVRVSAAAKIEETAADIPAAVTVVTADEIAAHGWRSLAEILGAQSGFFVYTDRIYDFVVPRGFALSNDPNSRLLLLLDGHRMVETFGYFNGHLPSVDVSQIERVEIVRGPVSAVYGTNAVFGVINVVTRAPTPEGRGSAVVEAGNFGQEKLALSLGLAGETRAATLHLSAERGGEEGLFFPEYSGPQYPTGGHTHPGNNGLSRAVAHLALRSGAWRGQAYYGRRRKRVPTAIYGGRLDDERTFFQDENAFFEVRGDWRFARHQGWVKLFADRYRFTGRFGFVADPAGVLGPPYDSEFNRVESGSYGGEALWLAEWNDRQRTVADVEWRRYGAIDFLYTSEDGPPPTRSQAFHRDGAGRVLSLGLAHQVRFAGGWLAELGLHRDEYPGIGGKTALRGALDWTARDDLRIKLLFGQAHRAPNEWERSGGFFLLGNPGLRPDSSSTIELVARLRLGPRSALRASLYRTVMSETIEKDPAQARFINAGGYRAAGAEAEWEFTGARDRAAFSAAWTPVSRRTTGERIEFAPRWTAKARWSRETAGGPRLALEAEAAGDRLKGKRDEPRLPAYGLLHAALSEVKLGERWTAALTVRNLLDKRYENPSFVPDLATYYQNALYPVYDIPAEGRSIVLGIRGRF